MLANLAQSTNTLARVGGPTPSLGRRSEPKNWLRSYVMGLRAGIPSGTLALKEGPVRF
jgi:hypothetical protein